VFAWVYPPNTPLVNSPLREVKARSVKKFESSQTKFKVEYLLALEGTKAFVT